MIATVVLLQKRFTRQYVTLLCHPAVLGLSLLLEGYSLGVAVRSVATGAEAAGVSVMEFVRRGTDPTSIAVMLEDAGAVAGLVIAGDR